MQLEATTPDVGARPSAWRVAWRTPGTMASAALTTAGGIAIASMSGKFMGREVVLCLLLAALIVAPLALRVATGSFDLFEPAVMIAIVYFVYFVFAPLVRFATDDMTFVGHDFQATYLEGLVAVGLAVCAMWAGYAMPVGPAPATSDVPAPGIETSLRIGRLLGRWLLVAAVCCMVLWAFIARRSLGVFLLPGLVPSDGASDGGGTDIAYLFLSIEWFIPALVILAACGGLRRKSVRIGALLAVTLLYVSIGFRYRIVVLWLAVGMLTYLQSGRRPRIVSLAVPSAIAFLFAGWLAQARLYFRSGGAIGSLGFRFRDTLLAGLSDTRIFETFGAVLATIPRFTGFAGFTPVAYVLFLPIPRFLWPGKPTPFWLGDIARSIGTAEASDAGVFVPHFGEFYVALGWPGIAVGMFVFGVAAKWLWRWFRAAPHDPWRQAIFVLHNALIFQVIIRGYLAQVIQEWCFIVLPALVIGAVARQGARVDTRRSTLGALSAERIRPEGTGTGA